MKLEGKTAVVTGATGGLGRVIAGHLGSRGARLVLTGRRAEALEPIARELRARPIVCDLADRGALDALIAGIRDADVLIANAGLPATGRIEEIDVEAIDRALDVNLRAPMLLARAVAPHMVSRGEGHIVFINSLSGKTAAPLASLYSATKFGLRGFAQCLRQDLHGTGVVVSSVFPGFIRDAGMFAKSGAVLPTGVGTKAPEDVAGAVVRAIERGEGDIDVAPVALSLGALVSGALPEVAATLTRWAGAGKVAGDIARGQTGKT